MDGDGGSILSRAAAKLCSVGEVAVLVEALDSSAVDVPELPMALRVNGFANVMFRGSNIGGGRGGGLAVGSEAVAAIL